MNAEMDFSLRPLKTDCCPSAKAKLVFNGKQLPLTEKNASYACDCFS